MMSPVLDLRELTFFKDGAEYTVTLSSSGRGIQVYLGKKTNCKNWALTQGRRFSSENEVIDFLKSHGYHLADIRLHQQDKRRR